MKVLAFAVAWTAVGALAGCPSDSTSPTLASATSRYDAGQYESALSEGEAVIARGPSQDRGQAELLSGMAAFQLERFDAAERHFIAAEKSAAPAIRGRARVMLANIRLEQGRTVDAATLFDSGASDLAGADAEKARRYASLARDGQLGNSSSRAPTADAVGSERTAAATPSAPPVSARGQVSDGQPDAPSRKTPPKVEVASKPAAVVPASTASKASSQSTATARTSIGAGDSATAEPDRDAATGGAFTVRAGAYTTESAARRRVKALAADVRRSKSPTPHIATVTTKDGDTLYAVRIGSFRSRAEAEALLKRLARKDLAVGAT